MTALRRAARVPCLLVLTAACAAPGGEAPEASEELVAVTHVHHAIDYIEIPVADMAAAKAFYGGAFGWTFNDYGPEYAGIRRGEGESGGLRLVDEVVPGGPLVILYSEDLEASLDGVRRAGGAIVEEIFTFPGGRRFEFTDPGGTRLAVWAAP